MSHAHAHSTTYKCTYTLYAHHQSTKRIELANQTDHIKINIFANGL